MEVWVENLKIESRKFNIFQTNLCGKQNSNIYLSLYSIFMIYDSELFSNVCQFVFYYSSNKNTLPISIYFIYKIVQTLRR